MLLIDKSFFVGRLKIANLYSSNTDNAEDFDLISDEAISNLLEETLGNLQFLDLKSNTDANGQLITTAQQKWVDLVNGKNYNINGIDKVWKGLIYSIGNQKYSLLADFVFVNWLLRSNNLTDLGSVNIQFKNGIVQSPNLEIVNNFNSFVEQYKNAGSLTGYETFKNGVKFIDYFNNNSSNNFTTLEAFLTDFSDIYSGFSIINFEFINRFSL